MKRTVRRTGGRRPQREKVSGRATTRARRSSGEVDEKQVVTPRQRRVRFSSTLCEVVGEVNRRDEMTDQEKKELYLTGADMQQIRADAKFITKYFRVKDRYSVAQLDEAYLAAASRSSAYETNEHFDDFMGNDDHQMEQVAAPLTEWCRRSKVSGRGLERYCSQLQRAERTAFASECRAAVLRLCESKSITADDVAKFYHEYTRSIVIYARLMGHADHIGAKEAAAEMAMAEAAQGKTASVQVQPRQVYQQTPKVAGEQDGLWFDRNDLLVQVSQATHEPPKERCCGTAANVVITTLQEAHSLEQSLRKTSSPPTESPSQKASPFDRRKLLLMSKQQQSSSARLMVERFGNASRKRMNFV
jgi:hypothetical protein